jgi:hypothetical protein
MAEGEVDEGADAPADGVPEWEREPVTLPEACEALLAEVGDIESLQRSLVGMPGLRAPGPIAMRRAHVFRFAATIVQIVHENSEEFRAMIAAKRAKEAKARAKRGGAGSYG